MGTADICALITKSAIIIRAKTTGINQILLEWEIKIKSCLIVSNILNLTIIYF